MWQLKFNPSSPLHGLNQIVVYHASQSVRTQLVPTFHWHMCPTMVTVNWNMKKWKHYDASCGDIAKFTHFPVNSKVYSYPCWEREENSTCKNVGISFPLLGRVDPSERKILIIFYHRHLQKTREILKGDELDDDKYHGRTHIPSAKRSCPTHEQHFPRPR